MRRAFIILTALVLSAPAYAKDDTPNVAQLAIDHPWTPPGPSTTAIALRCGDQETALVLAVDERGWQRLTGPNLDALVTPAGRFSFDGKAWRRETDTTWAERRIAGVDLDLVFGRIALSKAWRVTSVTTKGTVITAVFQWEDRRRRRSFDTIDRVWTFELRDDGQAIRVLEHTRFRDRRVPTTVAIGDRCTMHRRTKDATVKMPATNSLPH